MSLAYFYTIQNEHDFVRRDTGIYFTCFLCRFIRREEVVNAQGGRVIGFA
jgi:hypothetical protein